MSIPDESFCKIFPYYKMPLFVVNTEKTLLFCLRWCCYRYSLLATDISAHRRERGVDSGESGRGRQAGATRATREATGENFRQSGYLLSSFQLNHFRAYHCNPAGRRNPSKIPADGVETGPGGAGVLAARHCNCCRPTPAVKEKLYLSPVQPSLGSRPRHSELSRLAAGEGRDCHSIDLVLPN